VGYSAPTQAAIRADLNLSLAEVSIILFFPSQLHLYNILSSDLFIYF